MGHHCYAGHPLQPQHSSGDNNSRYGGLPRVHLPLHRTYARCPMLYSQGLTPTPHSYSTILIDFPQREMLVHVFLRSPCISRFVFWPERNLVHCIAAPARTFSNHDRSFLGSNNRITPKILDTVWSGYGPRPQGSPHSSTHSDIVVKCRLQKSMGFVRFKPRV